MSMSKSTSLASGANMCSRVGQSRPCRCTVSSIASEPRQGAAHERVLDGRLDRVLAEPPELELHAGLAAVAEAADGLHARSVEAEASWPCGGRRAPVGQEHRVRVGGARGRDRGRVERLVREGLGEGAGDGLAVGAIDGDHQAVVVAAHQEVADAGLVERIADGAEVLDHRLLRRHVPVAQGVVALADDEVVAIESRRAGRGRHQHELRGIREPHRRGRCRLPPRERVPGVVVLVGRSIAVGSRHGRVASRGRRIALEQRGDDPILSSGCRRPDGSTATRRPLRGGGFDGPGTAAASVGWEFDEALVIRPLEA